MLYANCHDMLQAAEAVARLSAAGVAHGDLKPANMLLQQHAGGRLSVLLCDLGGSTVNRRLLARDQHSG
jgi:serine/threonine protein kinase